MGQLVTAAHEIGAGVLAGIVDACACHPVDQVKTQFHVNKQANGSVVRALTEAMRSGGVTSLYRGLPAAALRPQALCMYTGNEWCKVCGSTRSSGVSDTDRSLCSARGLRHWRAHAAYRHGRRLPHRLLGEHLRHAL